jgi:hypothetical protein
MDGNHDDAGSRGRERREVGVSCIEDDAPSRVPERPGIELGGADKGERVLLRKPGNLIRQLLIKEAVAVAHDQQSGGNLKCRSGRWRRRHRRGGGCGGAGRGACLCGRSEEHQQAEHHQPIGT